jgi:hypothetical protein
MPAILLNWKRVDDRNRKRIDQESTNPVVWWDELIDEAAATRSGRSVFRRWSVANTKAIGVGARAFLIAQGGISDGIIASGFVAEPPNGKKPLRDGSAVYSDANWRTGDPSNYVTIEFDAILDVRTNPGHALPMEHLQTGDLAVMYWSVQRGGVEIRPRRRLHLNTNLLPQLEQVWRDNLQRVSFR